PSDGLGELLRFGVGGTFDLDSPFLLVSQHPVTTEYGDGERQIAETLKAVQAIGLPAIVLWPNADAGSEHIARGIRKFREHEDDSRLHFFKNLATDDYVKLMAKTACLVGNSSSASASRSTASPGTTATRDRVVARSVAFLVPPSSSARSPTSAPGPTSATSSPSTSTARTPSSRR